MDGINWVRKQDTWTMRRGGHTLEIRRAPGKSGDYYSWRVTGANKPPEWGVSRSHTPINAKKAAYAAYSRLTGEEDANKSEG